MAIFKSGAGGRTEYSDTPSGGGVELVSSLGKLVPRAVAERRLDPARAPEAITDQTGEYRRSGARVDTAVETVASTDGLLTFTARFVRT